MRWNGSARADDALTSTRAPAHPTRPEVVSIEHGYDYSSNRTFAYDARFQNGWPMNHTYANDPLNRLTAMMRNTRANLPDPGDAMVEGIFGGCVESDESRHVEDFQVGGQPPCKYKPNGTPAATGGGPGNGRGPEGCRPVGMSRILARVRLPECASKRL